MRTLTPKADEMNPVWPGNTCVLTPVASTEELLWAGGGLLLLVVALGAVTVVGRNRNQKGRA